MVALWEEDPRAPPFPKKKKKKEKDEMSDAPTTLRWPATFADDQTQDDDDVIDDDDGKARGGDSTSCAHQNHGAVVEIPRVWEPLLSSDDGPLPTSGGGNQRPDHQQEASSSRLDLLSSTCFTDFAALTSGLLVGPSAKGGCSLNWWERHKT